MTFKQLQKKHDCTCIDIYGFFEAIEKLSMKLYKEVADGEMAY